MRKTIIARAVRLSGGLCALLVFTLGAGYVYRYFLPNPKEIPAADLVGLEPAIASTSTLIRVDPFLLDAPFFWRQEAVPESCPEGEPLPILVLPHYIPLYDRIQRTLATWKVCAASVPVRRVIVIGPDHRQRLERGVATLSGSGYATPLGEVAIDEEIRSRLIAQGIQQTDALFRDEHSVGVFPMFVKQRFPEATLVPIVFSARATQAEAERVGDVLRPLLDDGSTLVIISADFSHYLTRPEADRHDRELAAAIARRDAAFIWAARDPHTDFGRGLWLALRLAGDASFRRVAWVNSADVGGPVARTTSFWFGWWERPPLSR